MKHIADQLKQKGLAVTAQRAAVMEFLAENRDHPSPDEVYKKVKKKFSFISRATVYNTIRALTKAGVLQEVLVQQESTRVDPNVEPHHHFKCLKCGKIEDMPYDLLTAAQAKVQLKGYEIREVRMLIEGRCKTCR